jgi:hypothetical protein
MAEILLVWSSGEERTYAYGNDPSCHQEDPDETAAIKPQDPRAPRSADDSEVATHDADHEYRIRGSTYA